MPSSSSFASNDALQRTAASNKSLNRSADRVSRNLID